MRRLLLMVFLFALVACSSAQVAAPPTVAVVQGLAPTEEPPAPPAPMTPTLPPATFTPIPPTLTPTPTGPPKVGVQVGHWKSDELPDELERFRTSTGAFAAGVSEVEVNLPVAERVVAILEANGIDADLLPATVPVGYTADAFITIHADGSTALGKRGFKMATPWRASQASLALLEALETEYAAGTGFEMDSAITVNMRGYYAFNWRRHSHAVGKTTPAVIVEMGFLTNPTDRAVMLENPDLIANSIAAGVLRYLDENVSVSAEALEPPNFSTFRPRNADTPVHAAPSADSEVLGTLAETGRFWPFREQDGWYEGMVRGGSRLVGWVRADDLLTTNEPFPTPAPLDSHDQ